MKSKGKGEDSLCDLNLWSAGSVSVILTEKILKDARKVLKNKGPNFVLLHFNPDGTYRFASHVLDEDDGHIVAEKEGEYERWVEKQLGDENE
jgi:hypothetical protein